MIQKLNNDQLQQLYFESSIPTKSFRKHEDQIEMNPSKQSFFDTDITYERHSEEEINRFESFFNTHVYPTPQTYTLIKENDILEMAVGVETSQLEKDLREQVQVNHKVPNIPMNSGILERAKVAKDSQHSQTPKRDDDLMYLEALVNNEANKITTLDSSSLSDIFTEIVDNEKKSISNYEPSVFDANVQMLFDENPESSFKTPSTEIPAFNKGSLPLSGIRAPKVSSPVLTPTGTGVGSLHTASPSISKSSAPEVSNPTFTQPKATALSPHTTLSSIPEALAANNVLKPPLTSPPTGMGSLNMELSSTLEAYNPAFATNQAEAGTPFLNPEVSAPGKDSPLVTPIPMPTEFNIPSLNMALPSIPNDSPPEPPSPTPTEFNIPSFNMALPDSPPEVSSPTLTSEQTGADIPTLNMELPATSQASPPEPPHPTFTPEQTSADIPTLNMELPSFPQTPAPEQTSTTFTPDETGADIPTLNMELPAFPQTPAPEQTSAGIPTLNMELPAFPQTRAPEQTSTGIPTLNMELPPLPQASAPEALHPPLTPEQAGVNIPSLNMELPPLPQTSAPDVLHPSSTPEIDIPSLNMELPSAFTPSAPEIPIPTLTAETSHIDIPSFNMELPSAGHENPHPALASKPTKVEVSTLETKLPLAPEMSTSFDGLASKKVIDTKDMKISPKFVEATVEDFIPEKKNTLGILDTILVLVILVIVSVLVWNYRHLLPFDLPF